MFIVSHESTFIYSWVGTGTQQVKYNTKSKGRIFVEVNVDRTLAKVTSGWGMDRLEFSLANEKLQNATVFLYKLLTFIAFCPIKNIET